MSEPRIDELTRENRRLARELEDRTAALRRSLEEIKHLTKHLQRENLYLREEMQNEFHDVIGSSADFRKVLEQAARVAPTDAGVLLLGETGTGKEVVAHLIHRLSRRRDKPLVRVNCAALTDTLVASELFGHEKGAFTGADRRKIGRFELAAGGTIFLDEIGEISPDVQAKLLRVLQERELERVGGTETIPVDVRVIAASNRELKAAVDVGRFREDLFFRLNVFPVRIPPLRERRQDIEPLALYFLERLARKTGRRFSGLSPRTRESFRSYQWPGNVRELQNLIERAVILSDGPELEIDVDLPAATGGSRILPALGAAGRTDPENGTERELKTLEALTKSHIADALRRTRGKVFGSDGAAAMLGVKPTTLQGMIKRLGLGASAPK